MNNFVKFAIAAIIIALVLPFTGAHPVWSVAIGILAFFSGLWGFGKMEEEGLLP